MSLITIIGKVLFKKSVDATGETIGKAVVRRKEIKNEASSTDYTLANENKTGSRRRLSTSDKILQTRILLLIILVCSIVGMVISSNNAKKYAPTWQKVGEYVVKQYGIDETKKGDYARIKIVSAVPVVNFTSTYSSQFGSGSTSYDIYNIQDEIGHTALYCDVNESTLAAALLVDGSSFPFLNEQFPYTAIGRLTNIRDEFHSATDYSKYVTEDMETLDMIEESSPPDGVYDYVQSDEDKQQWQLWNTIHRISMIIFLLCIVMFIVLIIVSKVKNRKNIDSVSHHHAED